MDVQWRRSNLGMHLLFLRKIEKGLRDLNDRIEVWKGTPFVFDLTFYLSPAEPKHVTVKWNIGEQPWLFCNFTAKSGDKVTWTKQEINSSQTQPLNETQWRTNGLYQFLRLNAEPSDAGIYTCKLVQGYVIRTTVINLKIKCRWLHGGHGAIS